MLKSNFKLFLLLFSLSMLFTFTSCEDGYFDLPIVDPVVTNTIVDIALADTQFSSLVAALQQAELVETLQGDGPFTVFAPTNDAFTELLTNLGTDLASIEKDALTDILLNHVIGGDIRSTDLENGYVSTSSTAGAGGNNLSMYVDITDGVKLNGMATVTTADVVADNGVVHVVDKVITLPNIVDLVSAKPELSELVGAVVKAELVGALSGDGPLTVFAPTNTAFSGAYALLGVDGYDQILNSTLIPTLQYHVASGNTLSTDLSDGLMVTTLNPVSPEVDVNIDAAGNVSLTDKSDDTNDAAVTMVDIQGTNGVIHVIDAVMLPQF